MSQLRPLRFVSLFAVFALILTACAADEEEPASEPDDPATEEEPDDPATEEEPDDPATEEEPDDPAPEPLSFDMGGFNPPSLGAFLPAVIEANDFDAEFGFDIDFNFRAPPAYNTEFAAGQWPVGSSAALLSEAVRYNAGVDIVYLFNVYDYFGAVLATTDEVQDVQDLTGTTLAASTVTTNYAMFQWFAEQQGADLSDITVEDTGTGGLLTMAVTGRTDAVQLWEPAYTIAVNQDPSLRTLDLGFEAWEENFGLPDIPYIGVAAHRDWVEENADRIDDLYELFRFTAQWIEDNPEEAAEIIADTIPDGDSAPILELIQTPERMAFNVVPAAEVADGIRAVWEVGLEVGWIDEAPDDDIIYGLD